MERLITGNSDLNVKIVAVSLLKILNINRFYSYTKALIERLILEKISWAGIAWATGVSIRWLQNYVNKKYAEIYQEIWVMKKPSCQLTLQLDEMWSFVKNKRKKQWLWIALDQKTREIVGLYIGDRSKKSAS